VIDVDVDSDVDVDVDVMVELKDVLLLLFGRSSLLSVLVFGCSLPEVCDSMLVLLLLLLLRPSLLLLVVVLVVRIVLSAVAPPVFLLPWSCDFPCGSLLLRLN